MTEINQNTNFLIVGLGLIGGSYAEALTKQGYTVNAITRSEKTLKFALDKGLIKKGSTEIDENIIKEADIIVFALYPHILIEWLRENQKYIKPGTLITDVTGVKVSVVPAVQEILKDGVEFIGSHPMAGKESYGIENADCEIFKKANFIVTPTERNSEKAINICKQFGKILGFARISELSIEEHDKMIGFLSQLTHCIAVSLMTCNDNENIVKYTGDSFRDLVRIAKINDVMWSELFLLNKKYLTEEIDIFVNELEKIKIYLENDDKDSLMKMMRKSTERKIKFDKNEK